MTSSVHLKAPPGTPIASLYDLRLGACGFSLAAPHMLDIMAPPLLPQKHTVRSLPATPTTDGKCDSQEFITVHPAPPTPWKGRRLFFCVVLMLHTISQLPVAWRRCPPRGCSDVVIDWLSWCEQDADSVRRSCSHTKLSHGEGSLEEKTSQCWAVRNASSRWT